MKKIAGMFVLILLGLTVVDSVKAEAAPTGIMYVHTYIYPPGSTIAIPIPGAEVRVFLYTATGFSESQVGTTDVYGTAELRFYRPLPSVGTIYYTAKGSINSPNVLWDTQSGSTPAVPPPGILQYSVGLNLHP